jgi:hypothetical protein
MILAQLSYGMTTPFGVLPAGMELATGSTLWSPDGTTALSFSAPTVPYQEGASQLMLSVGGSYPEKGLSQGANVPAWTAHGCGTLTKPPKPPAILNGGSLTMGTNGVATVSDSTGNPVWNSPQPASALLGKPYLEIGDGGMWVQDAGNPGFPVWGTTPPQGTFELHQTQNLGEVQIPTGPGGNPQNGGVGINDSGCMIESGNQVQVGQPQPGGCAQLSYVTSMNGQASVQGTGWLQPDGNAHSTHPEPVGLRVHPRERRALCRLQQLLLVLPRRRNHPSLPGVAGGRKRGRYLAVPEYRWQMQQCPTAPRRPRNPPFTMMTPGPRHAATAAPATAPEPSDPDDCMYFDTCF